jgi:hypothetical protein
MVVVYKISITIYSTHTYILDIHTVLDGLVWLYTLSTYSLSGHLYSKSKDIHKGHSRETQAPVIKCGGEILICH